MVVELVNRLVFGPGEGGIGDGKGIAARSGIVSFFNIEHMFDYRPETLTRQGVCSCRCGLIPVHNRQAAFISGELWLIGPSRLS